MSDSNSVKKIIPQVWCNFLFDYPIIYKSIYCTRKPIFSHKNPINIAPKQPLDLLKQSFNNKIPEITIPSKLMDLYLTYRPTPLRRAIRLEKMLNSPARIYYKYEGANLAGSHKLNTALAQAYYYKKAGVEHIVTGTGAGQWGTAISYACQLFGLKCTVFMVGVSLRQKPQRFSMMQLFGAEVISSPSLKTEVGRLVQQKDVENIGSLAIATAEAIEFVSKIPKAQFAIGSGENCVLLHQTIIGNEAIHQLKEIDVFPDYVFACMGAGSNFAGIGLPLLREAKKLGKSCELIAIEPIGCPKLTRGIYAYDINDFSGSTPISKMYTLGSDFLAPGIHAGGLRYHGTSEFLSALYDQRLFSARAIPQSMALKAGLLFAESEGILVAPESAHAIAGAIQYIHEEPNRLKGKSILINVSGHGLFDLTAYNELKAGQLDDGYPNESLIQSSLKRLIEQNKNYSTI